MFSRHFRTDLKLRVTKMAFSRSMSKDQRDGFEDRLSRIKKGGANTAGEVQIGPRDEIRAGDKRASKPANSVRIKQRRRKKKEVGRGSTLSLIILAFAFGALSMFVGQAAGFHFFGGGLVPIDLSGTPLEPYLPQAHFAIGGVLALLFCWTFRLTSMMRIIAMVAGLAVMVQYHTEMVQQAPGVYQKFFSKGYVKRVQAEAGQNIPA